MKNTTENNRFRMFEVKYFGASNCKGSRVKINDLRHGKSKTIPYNYSMNNIEDMAESYLKKIGISCDGLALTNFGSNYILSHDFATPLK